MTIATQPVRRPQNVLITGGSGFFGMNAAVVLRSQGVRVVLCSSEPERYQVFDTNNEVFQRLNILEPHSIAAALHEHQPDIVIHAAAYSQPLRCQQEPDHAVLLNVQGTVNMVNAAQMADIPLVYLSTDLVFDGNMVNSTVQNGNPTPEAVGENRWYRETDVPNPVIVYGATKLAAEGILQNSTFNRWIILRSALMLGKATAWTQGFPHFATCLLREGKSATLFTDQYRTPVSIADLVRAVLLAVQYGCFGSVFHVGGGERVSRAECVEQYCRLHAIPTNGIRAVPMAAVPEYTTHVRDVALDHSKLTAATGWQPTPLTEVLSQIPP